MWIELKRALFKKSNIGLILLVCGMMFILSYNLGWSSAIKAPYATDLSSIEDVIWIQNYHGNVFRIWANSYTLVQALTPLILVSPYLLSYFNEKSNKFRYLVIARKGRISYSFQKMLAIALAGAIILGFAQLLFAAVSYVFTSHDLNIEFIENLTHYNEAFFLNNPYKYFAYILISQIVYYFSLLIFSIGITSLLKNKVVIILTPFIAVAFLDMILPLFMQPNVVTQPMYPNFTIDGYLFLIVLYLVLGLATFAYSEMNYYRKGN